MKQRIEIDEKDYLFSKIVTEAIGNIEAFEFITNSDVETNNHAIRIKSKQLSEKRSEKHLSRSHVVILEKGSENSQKLSLPFHINQLVKLVKKFKPNNNSPTHLGPWMLDTNTGILTSEFTQIKLTETELQILTALITKKGEVITKEQLLTDVWGYNNGTTTHTVETYVYRLRQKIEADPAVPKILLTKNNGYTIPSN